MAASNTEFQSMAQQALLQQQVGAAPAAVGSTFTTGTALPAATDTYFNGELGLVSAFDFDYDNIISFNQSLGWALWLAAFPLWPATTVCCVPCFLNNNVEWEARAQHVALTADGIRYVQEKRKSMCGLMCSDKGKVSKTVPYDKITDCDLQEPAGMACCCCIPRVLAEVSVDTASSGVSKEGIPQHELSLRGLKNPTEFKQAVWGMKRSQKGSASMAGSFAPAQLQMTQPSGAEMMQVFTEMRDELREVKELLKTKS